MAGLLMVRSIADIEPSLAMVGSFLKIRGRRGCSAQTIDAVAVSCCSDRDAPWALQTLVQRTMEVAGPDSKASLPVRESIAVWGVWTYLWFSPNPTQGQFPPKERREFVFQLLATMAIFNAGLSAARPLVFPVFHPEDAVDAIEQEMSLLASRYALFAGPTRIHCDQGGQILLNEAAAVGDVRPFLGVHG